MLNNIQQHVHLHLKFDIVFDFFLHLIDIGATNVCII